MKKEKKAIFIHSLFRTGSTFIWNKFRQNDRYYCYYEPLHQSLLKVTVNNIENLMTKDFGSVNHPALINYYLYEYKPILGSGSSGLPYFKKTYSFDEFCNNENNPDLKKYIDNLIIGAGDKFPVLQFNRSAFRVKWFKQNYPDSLNIYLVRHPRDQWQSYFEVHKNTNYIIFFVMDLLTASVNKEREYFKPLSLSLPLFEYHDSSYYREENFYQVILNSYSEEEKYFIFYYTWFMALIENVLYADFILNINLLSQKPLYRENVIDFLIKQGIEGIDFKDAQIAEYSSNRSSAKVMNEIEKKVHYLVLQSIPEDHFNSFFEKIPTFDRKYFQLNKKKFLNLKKKKFWAVSQQKIADKLEKMILLFSEEFFHLKEKNNILHISLDDKKNLLKQKETQIDVKDMQLALKDRQISKKDEQLARKDETLREKLSEKDKLINEKDKQLALKDRQISKKDEQLARKDETLREKLSEKDKLINGKDKQLVLKDLQLDKKDEQLTRKDEVLKQRLNEKDKLINEKDKQLTLKDLQLGKKDEQLAQKDEVLKQRLNEKDKQLALKDLQLGRKDEQLARKYEVLKKRLDEKDKQLALKELQLNKNDEQLMQKDKKLKQELSEKEDLLRKKGQELAEKGQQLCEKVQQLELKEAYIQKIFDSYTYKTGRILLFPFIKLKRLIKKREDK